MAAGGKVYVMELVPSGWAVLTHAEQADFCGIPCIKGRWLTVREDNWATGRVTYVPTAHIQSIVIVDSPEEYVSAMGRAGAAAGTSLDPKAPGAN